MDPLYIYIVSMVFFVTGIFGVLAARHTVTGLCFVTLMLLAASINILAGSAPLNNAWGVMGLCIILAEVLFGTALVLVRFRLTHSIDTDTLEKS